MLLLHKLAEQKIRAAQERGELDNLPGEGRPLVLDDDSAVPAELRAGYRLLKNAGFLPAELEQLKQIRQLEALLPELECAQEYRQAARRLNSLRAQLSGQGQRFNALMRADDYRQKLFDKLTGEHLAGEG